MTRSEPAPGWFRKHFNEDYRIIYGGRDKAQASLEVALVVKVLGIQPGERVLDLCCGHGRHLAAFAAHGIPAVGADLSRALLSHVKPGKERRVVCADMRALPFGGGGPRFSVVVNFFTSFGYFDSDEENLLAAREMARVLEPGGRFSLDLMNAASAIASLERRTERAAGPFRLVEDRRYDAARRRIEKEITLVHRGRPEGEGVRRYFESVRVFEPADITELLRAAGLEVDRMLGDFTGRPRCDESPRMIILGRKRRP